MTIKWKEFITTDFWFGIDRTGLHLTDRVILYIGGSLVLLGIAFLIFRVVSKNKFLKNVAKQFSTIFFVIGFSELIWYGLRLQFVQALGSRFTAAIIALIGLIWLYWPVKYLLSRYKVDMAEAQKQMMREKYLQR